MSIKNRLKYIIDCNNLNLKEFSEITNIPYRTLQNYLLGLREPNIDILKKLSTQLGININWLLTGEGEPYISGNLGSEYALVPVIEGYISAGVGLYPVEHSEIKLAFRKDWISRYGDYKKMSLIYVRGDSMEPTIWDGDIVLVNHNVKNIKKNGAIYAIVIDNLIMIKRLQKIGNNKVLVISDNQKYPAYETKESDLDINGQVIWFGHEIERNPDPEPEEKTKDK